MEWFLEETAIPVLLGIWLVTIYFLLDIIFIKHALFLHDVVGKAFSLDGDHEIHVSVGW